MVHAKADSDYARMLSAIAGQGAAISSHFSKELSLELVTKPPENNSSSFLNMHFDKEL